MIATAAAPAGAAPPTLARHCENAAVDQKRAVLAVAAGGVVGGLARYGIGALWPVAAGGFGWSTFVVNASGCLLIGVLLGRLARVDAPAWVRPALGTGVLGGYTTFSGHTAEAVDMLAHNEPILAVAYLASTLIVAVVAVWLGLAISRRRR